MKRLILLCSVACMALAFNSCCSCTEIACQSETAAIRFELDINDFNNTDIRDFEEMWIVRTDTQFVMLDSVEVILNPISTTEYNFFINPIQFGQSFELSQFNYLIKNPAINQIDSVYNISYSSESSEEVCNQCDGWPNCDDETYLQVRYSDPEMMLNDEEIDSFTILYMPKS